MVCIYCGSDTQVTNSRSQKKLNYIWRRRKCTACGAVFTTSENIDLLKSLVVIKNNRLEPFSRDKLFLSVYGSLLHRKTAQSDATSLTDTIIGHLYPLVESGSIDVQSIIHNTSTVLSRFDKAAATHYAAFHPSLNSN